MIRLDKYLSDSGLFSRREASRLIRAGAVTVDGSPCRDPARKIDEGAASVTANGQPVGYARVRWFMLHKPADTVSTTEESPKSVMNLFPPELRRIGLFPCGRLDLDTTGLLLFTNDGPAAHDLLSPKKHCEKRYRFTCPPLSDEQIRRLEGGIALSDFTAKPCRVALDDPLADREHGTITVTEGKYHQIKRMFEAVGSEILALSRVEFAGIPLDPALAPGEWRELTPEEIALLHQNHTANGEE
ncbi:MAG: rRNA pseudouridine synthase [Clostridia bacterium]|nr:rRNA pseudouridine synthase [Clostridia bacterium]MBR5366212.1 rRNA pseudouridine synthase [Clostridia bacterium]